MALRDLVHPLEKLESLDSLADRLSARIQALIGTGPAKSRLSGTWLGHPLHPALTDLPIGALSAGSLLDIAGGAGAEQAADLLIAIGLIGVIPTAVSGWSDWSDTVGEDRRVGLVHAGANLAGVALYSLSMVARRRRGRGAGTVLGLLGATAVGAGAYLGGHLTLARGVGVDHTAFDAPPSEWTAVAEAAAVGEGAPHPASANGVGILLYRRGNTIYALTDRCTHAGGPLHEGQVDDDLCVTCPWHGSRFQLSDGRVRQGPATAPAPVYDVRVEEGRIEVRARKRG